MDEIQEQQGWNTDSMLTHALTYIQNQGSQDDFVDFLRQQADMENEG